MFDNRCRRVGLDYKSLGPISPVFDCTFGEPDYESPKMRGLTKAESEEVGSIVQSARLALSMRFHINLLHSLKPKQTR